MQLAVGVVAEVVAADADDASARRQRAVPERLEQRRHRFAPSQVAGAAKQDYESKGHDDALP